MEQMVDETAVRDKGRKHSAVAEEESSAWVRGGEFMWLRRRKQNTDDSLFLQNFVSSFLFLDFAAALFLITAHEKHRLTCTF